MYEALVVCIDANGAVVTEETSEATKNDQSLSRKRNWILLEHRRDALKLHIMLCPNYKANGRKVISNNDSTKCSETVQDFWRNPSVPI